MGNEKNVSVLGCCVSRDLFEYSDKIKVNKFVQLNPISIHNNEDEITDNLRGA